MFSIIIQDTFTIDWEPKFQPINLQNPSQSTIRLILTYRGHIIILWKVFWEYGNDGPNDT